MALAHILQQYFLVAWLGFKTATSSWDAWHFGYNLIFLLPALGTLCLALGLVLGIRSRNARLWYFLVPVLVTEGFLQVFKLLPRTMERSLHSGILIAGLALMVLALIVAFYKACRSVAAATALSIFGLTLVAYIAFFGALSVF